MVEEKKQLPIGDLLTRAGILSSETLSKRLDVAKTIGQTLGQTLVQLGDLTEAELKSAVQIQSLYLDAVLSEADAVETMSLVRQDWLCLEEALDRIGFMDDDNWTSKLGELMVAAGVLDEPALLQALKIAVEDSRPLGHILVESGMIKPIFVAKALSVQKRIRNGQLTREAAVDELRSCSTEETLEV